MKKVYVAMSADFIHSGHINIIKQAREYGSVTVGILTDSAIASYKRLPILTYDQRKEIIENIKGVEITIPQESSDYTENLLKLKPDYVFHGNNWKTGPQSKIREKVILTLNEWNGELIEPEYTTGLSTTQLALETQRGTTPERRLQSLRRLMTIKPLVRILEVHNGITGLIAENSNVDIDGEHRSFHGMWESSLTDSTAKGKPDTQAVDMSSRISTINEIFEVTSKPMIVDADNGGLTEHFEFSVRTMERLGVSAVIIEDKIGPKRNSLFGTDVAQSQDTIEQFSHKISQGKKAQVTKDFMIIARIESLILKQGEEDALNRARAYVKAGTDGIMIHSKEKSPDEIISFCTKFREEFSEVPLIVVPSSYAIITEEELQSIGVNVVIYANHLLRSAFPAMMKTAESILTHKRCHEASENCMSIKEILTLIPESI